MATMPLFRAAGVAAVRPAARGGARRQPRAGVPDDAPRCAPGCCLRLQPRLDDVERLQQSAAAAWHRGANVSADAACARSRDAHLVKTPDTAPAPKASPARRLPSGLAATAMAQADGATSEQQRQSRGSSRGAVARESSNTKHALGRGRRMLRPPRGFVASRAPRTRRTALELSFNLFSIRFDTCQPACATPPSPHHCRLVGLPGRGALGRNLDVRSVRHACALHPRLRAALRAQRRCVAVPQRFTAPVGPRARRPRARSTPGLAGCGTRRRVRRGAAAGR